MSSFISFLHTLPKSPHVDVSTITGNVPLAEKQLGANAFHHFVTGTKGSYGVAIGERIRIVDVNVEKKEGTGLESRTICEIEVKEDMCNVHSVMHGGCAALLVDSCTSSAIVQLGIHLGHDTSGMSQTMNIIYHQPAKLGATLRIVNTTLTVGGRLMAARTEIFDKEIGKLLISAVHTVVNPAKARDKKPQMSKL